MRSLSSTIISLCLLLAGATSLRAQADDPSPALQELIDAAETEGMTPANDGADSGEAFTLGSIGLQELNPEISITGDILCVLRDDDDDGVTSDFVLRGLGLHTEAYLDPYTHFKAAASFDEHDVHLGEAYMTRFGLLPHINLTLGKFRQQFGVVNRWHKHGLDQIDFPLALRSVFGNGGLNQVGCSLDWGMPTIGHACQELTLQFTDGQNGRVFGQNTDNRPSLLGHYRIYYDLTPSSYVELGTSGLYGRNNEWQVCDGAVDEGRDVFVGGLDLTFLWEPTDRMRYHSVTWRSEFYALDKDILAPDGSGPDTVNAWGGYSSLEARLGRTLFLGVRADYFEPDTKAYVADNAWLSPLTTSEADAYQWQVSPYLTWHQSPFVHFRVEYDHQGGDGVDCDNDTVWLQCVFAAGPHKHERY